MLKSHKFTVRIKNKAYELTKGFSFGRDLKMMGSGFNIVLIDPETSLLKEFRPGAECQIEVDDNILAKGFLDTLNLDDSNGHVFTYHGRDRAGDLIDCSAMFSNGGFERSNIYLDDAIKDILKPFDMPLTVVGDVGDRFSKLSITPGDTVLNFIDQVCKYRGLFPLSDGVGGLILTSVSNIRSEGSLVFGENVLSRSGSIDHQQRFSEIIVKGQVDAGGIGNISAEKLSGSQGIAKDPDIARYRPLIIQAEKEGYDLTMQGRAEWEVRHRRFSGTLLNYNVAGWEAGENSLWKINTLVPVTDSKLLIARDMLIKSITLSRDKEGTYTQIGVAPAEAYDLPALRHGTDDALWGGGA